MEKIYQLPIRSKNEEVGVTQIRLRLLIPPHYQQAPILSDLITQFRLTVTITGAIAQPDTKGQFDLELRGTISRIQTGLQYLNSLGIEIYGKGNSGGDHWYS